MSGPVSPIHASSLHRGSISCSFFYGGIGNRSHSSARWRNILAQYLRELRLQAARMDEAIDPTAG
jgi:hypothetical protein